jgi:hypothetical protein
MSKYLIIGFNRAQLFIKQLERIKKLDPQAILFLHLDHPREGNTHDESQHREILDFLDAYISGNTTNIYVQDKNMGCRKSVEFAIDWFFNNVDAGFIIEDDLHFDERFLQFVEAQLDTLHNDDKVFGISGTVFRANKVYRKPLLTNYAHIWGWYSTAEKWQTYQKFIEQKAPRWKRELLVMKLSIKEWLYFTPKWMSFFNNTVDTWDYGVSFYCRAARNYFIVPPYNLVENIGFDTSGTHQLRDIDNISGNIQPVSFPLNASPQVNELYDMNLLNTRIQNKIRKLLRHE